MRLENGCDGAESAGTHNYVHMNKFAESIMKMQQQNMSRGKPDGTYQQDVVNDERDCFFNNRDDSGSVTRVGGVFTSNVEEAAAGRMNSVLNISITSNEKRDVQVNAVDLPAAESFVGSQSIDWSAKKED